MIDYVVSHWNNVITILAFVFSVITGYYQVQHYRSQRATIRVHNFSEATYGPRARDSYGSPAIVSDLSNLDEREMILSTQFKWI